MQIQKRAKNNATNQQALAKSANSMGGVMNETDL
jgi:hypothetical protein